MKTEVYKLYSDNIKILNTISTPVVSYESPYFPPDGKFNSDNKTVLNKFDSTGANYDLSSSIQDVILDYGIPSLVKDYSNYTAFKENNKASINIKFELKDNLGIDCDKFQLGFFYGTSSEQVLFERRHTFDDSNVPQGDIEETYNNDYEGPAKEVFAEYAEDTISKNSKDYITRNDAGNYIVDFNLNFFGDSTEGTLGLLYEDLTNGKYSTYEEFTAGNLFVKLYDLAGNEYVFTGFKQLTTLPWTLDKFLELVKPLTLVFYDTYPRNLFLPDDVIGKTSIFVKNENKDISEKYGFETKLELEHGSLGYLVDLNKHVDDYDLYQDVDGIDGAGYVKASAFLKSDFFDNATNNLLRTYTTAKGSLGPFVRQCEDNTRKLNVDPFVPEFAEGTLFHKFCKFLEQFLNTAWCPLDKDCKIGLLEKIARIGDFNDIDKIEYPAIQYWAEDRGSELVFDRKVMDAIKELSSQYNGLNTENYDCLRYLYRNLPLINMYKGTLNCFRLVFNSIGINAELIPLWGRKDGTGNYIPEYLEDRNVQNPAITDDYYLSSHVELKIHGYVASDLLKIASSLVTLARSVLPCVRVIEYLLIEEFSKSSNYLTLGYFDGSKTLPKEQNLLQCISFLWDTKDIAYKPVSEKYVDIFIPQVCERCSTDAASWWKGYNPAIGIVDGTTVDNIKIRNNRTLNPSKFLNMLTRTLRNHELKAVFDIAMLLDKAAELPEQDWQKYLKPLSPITLDIVHIKWDSGYYIIRINSDDLAKISRFSQADYAIMTFVFNRTTEFCYTAKLTTALAQPTNELPGYKDITSKK